MEAGQRSVEAYESWFFEFFVSLNDAWSQKGYLASYTRVILASRILWETDLFHNKTGNHYHTSIKKPNHIGAQLHTMTVVIQRQLLQWKPALVHSCTFPLCSFACFHVISQAWKMLTNMTKTSDLWTCNIIIDSGKGILGSKIAACRLITTSRCLVRNLWS